MYGFNSFYFYFFIIYVIYSIFINTAYQKSSSIYKNRMIMIWLFIPLFLLSGMRGTTVGGDLEYYIPYFEEASKAKTIDDLFQVSGHEPGYLLFTKMIGSIIPDNRFFLIVTSFVSLIGPFIFIHRCSPSPTLSLLMYYSMGFYTNTFNNVRQSIALSLVFISYYFLCDNRKMMFFLFVILASSIHFSAIILLLCYPLIAQNISLKKLSILLFGGIVIFALIGSSILSMFINLINLYFAKYDEDIASESVGWGMFSLYILICVFLLYIYWRGKEKLSEMQKQYVRIAVLFQILSILIQMYSSLFPSMLRLSSYFFIPIVVTLPYYFSVINDKLSRQCILIVSLVLCIMFFSFTYNYSSETSSNSQGVIPYLFLDYEIF